MIHKVINCYINGAVDLSQFFGALVKKASDQTTADYSGAVSVTFDAEVNDVGAWHDTGSNTDRLTVPANVSYVEVYAQFGTALVTSNNNCTAQIKKNGSALSPQDIKYLDGTAVTFPYLQVRTPILAVSAGDYFTFVASMSDSSVTIVAADTFFGIRRMG